MREYESREPLIFIHIPRCAGTSINSLLKKWFKENYFRHGFKKQSPWYRINPYELRPGVCISGHFSSPRDRGVHQLYPEVNQFITFLRDPIEIVLSNYFFWKRKI